MKIGYACICLKEPPSMMHTCIQRYATEAKLIEIITLNLKSLKEILIYNHVMGIEMFRISSDLIPFGSSPINTLPWRELFQTQFENIGLYIKKHNMRVSMHPGQYTIINSPNDEVVKRAILDLQYHCDVLDLMRIDASHKLVLHIGGVYGDKEEAMKRFVNQYQTLSNSIKQRLIIENDDRYYHVEDVLAISKQISIPVVFDNLHHTINPPCVNKRDGEWLDIINQTWNVKDGTQKMHYSVQDSSKRVGAHARAIQTDTFLDYVNQIGRNRELDIMLEVKDKDHSALKAVQLLYPSQERQVLQWTQYRHLIMERNPLLVKQIDEHIINLDGITFYRLIEKGLEVAPCNQLGTLHDLYQKLRPVLSIKEQQQYEKWLKRFENGEATLSRMKKMIYRDACKYHIDEIIQSYFLK